MGTLITENNMRTGRVIRHALVSATVSLTVLVGRASADEAVAVQRDRDHLVEPVYKSTGLDIEQLKAANGEHPLAPTVRMAKAVLAEIEQSVQDYSCRLVKRERIGDVLGDQQFIYTKVRHSPFSVYMYFLGPEDVKGREAL
jgi:hypothetical protein